MAAFIASAHGAMHMDAWLAALANPGNAPAENGTSKALAKRAEGGPRALRGPRAGFPAPRSPPDVSRDFELPCQAPRYLRWFVRDPINRGRGPTSWIAPGRALAQQEPPVSPHMMLVTKSISSCLDHSTMACENRAVAITSPTLPGVCCKERG